MLRSVRNLQRYTSVRQTAISVMSMSFYFDDEQWTVRYLVVDTASWRLGRLVLVSPQAIRQADWSARTMSLSITRDQIRNSPDIDTGDLSRGSAKPSSCGYHYPHYWGTPGWTIGGLEEQRAEDEARELRMSTCEVRAR